MQFIVLKLRREWAQTEDRNMDKKIDTTAEDETSLRRKVIAPFVWKEVRIGGCWESRLLDEERGHWLLVHCEPRAFRRQS
jgi:hypothetical protein